MTSDQKVARSCLLFVFAPAVLLALVLGLPMTFGDLLFRLGFAGVVGFILWHVLMAVAGRRRTRTHPVVKPGVDSGR